jgi:hypothetical protein
MPASTKKAARPAAKRRPASSKPPAAVRRLNRSLDAAQEALTHLRKDVGKDVSAGSTNLYNDVKRFVKDARRDSEKLANALQRDAEKAQARMRGRTQGKATSRKRAPARKAPARKAPARKAPARKTASR